MFREVVLKECRRRDSHGPPVFLETRGHTEGTQGCTAPNLKFGKIEVGGVVYDVYCCYYVRSSIGSE